MSDVAIAQASRRAWETVLKTSFDGDGNFFALGGNSLRAMRVLSLLSSELGGSIPLATIFEHPAFDAFVKQVGAVVAPATSAAPEAPTGMVPTPLHLERIMIYDELGIPTEPMMTVTRVRGRLDQDRLRAAIVAVAGRHDGMRLRFTTSIPARDVTAGREMLDVVTAHVADAQDAVSFRTRECAEGEINDQLTAFAEEPHDLAGGPRIRILVLRPDPAGLDWVVAVLVDHIVFDPDSREIFLREIGEVYDAPGPMPTNLPPGPSFAAYAQREWARMDTADGRRRLSHWAAVYRRGGFFPVATLPVLGGADAGTPGVARSVARRLPGGWLETVRERAAEHQTTFFNVVLTAFMLARHRRTDEGFTGTVVSLSNRTDASSEGLVGLVATAMPIWADLAEVTTFREAIGLITAATVSSIDNGAITMFTSAHLFRSGALGHRRIPMAMTRTGCGAVRPSRCSWRVRSRIRACV